MQTIVISHEHAPGYGWSYESGSPRMIGGYEPNLSASRHEAESAAYFALEGEAEDRGEAPPRPQDVRFEHVLERAGVAA